MTSPLEAVIAAQVDELLASMMAGARALNPDQIRAAYAPHPTVAINGVILDDWQAHFAAIRPWLTSLHTLDATYDNVHIEVLGTDAVVTTMNHHLSWTDATGGLGEWHSAWTAVLRCSEDRWRIVYSHESTQPQSQ